MPQLPNRDETGANGLSAGAQYRLHLSCYPERRIEPPFPRLARELWRAIQALARSARGGGSGGDAAD